MAVWIRRAGTVWPTAVHTGVYWVHQFDRTNISLRSVGILNSKVPFTSIFSTLTLDHDDDSFISIFSASSRFIIMMTFITIMTVELHPAIKT